MTDDSQIQTPAPFTKVVKGCGTQKLPSGSRVSQSATRPAPIRIRVLHEKIEDTLAAGTEQCAATVHLIQQPVPPDFSC